MTSWWVGQNSSFKASPGPPSNPSGSPTSLYYRTNVTLWWVGQTLICFSITGRSLKFQSSSAASGSQPLFGGPVPAGPALRRFTGCPQPFREAYITSSPPAPRRPVSRQLTRGDGPSRPSPYRPRAQMPQVSAQSKFLTQGTRSKTDENILVTPQSPILCCALGRHPPGRRSFYQSLPGGREAKITDGE